MSRFSVIVPVYNLEQVVESCIASLLAQDFQDMEILIVDDGSTDASGAICRDLAARDSRIRVIHRENGGLGNARNTGLDAATGEYICFVDGDDALEPHALSKLNHVIEQHAPDCVRYGCRRVGGKLDDQVRVLPYAQGLYTGQALEPLRLDAVNYAGLLDYRRTRLLSAWSCVFRRAFLEQHRLRFRSEREILNEDYLFVMQCMQVCRSVSILPEPLYRYMFRGDSITAVYRRNMFPRRRALYEVYCNLLPHDGEYRRRLDGFYVDGVYACIVNECTGKPAEAIPAIRALLRDEELQTILRRSRDQIFGKKAKCICALMRWRMAGAMYFGYRSFSQM